MTALSRVVTPYGVFQPAFVHWLAGRPDTVFLESARRDPDNQHSYLFTAPLAIISCHEPGQVEARLAEVGHALGQGHYAAGFLTYEAGYAFEERLPRAVGASLPLLWFGIYEQPLVYDHAAEEFTAGRQWLPQILERLPAPASEAASLQAAGLHPNLAEPDYERALAQIKAHIAAGDTYQVNFTFKLRFTWPQPPAALYCRLRQNQRVSYAALLTLPGHAILSFSPELFFRLEEDRLTLKPMKGTARRGRTLAEDEEQRQWLRHSEKNRAENLMIVDLLRHDAGRLAVTGSVAVPHFFEIERYETVQQATSTITARLRPEVTVPELLRCLFPSGSITGAPKLRTMQIIHALEREPRGIYTGSIGFFAPSRRAVFNVAIRTITLDTRSGAGEMGIGSGIVWDSDSRAEYHECLLKARFLGEPAGEFQLLETLRWDPAQGWLLLAAHLQRLQDSAAYFDFRCDSAEIMRRLEARLAICRREGVPCRVRLTLTREGELALSHTPLSPLVVPVAVRLAATRTNSQDRFLFHKTTRRGLYDRELAQAAAAGFFDVIFQNEKGEVTEGARTNVIIRKGGRYFTPPLACGVLPGIYRAHLLATQTLPVSEKVLRLEELLAADEILLCNSVRGVLPAKLGGE
ncbi:MAG: aminodeoxychorismate synthase component I [candidate division KSB1 bacterium]|nr:aminodeoxychorismate synthase component I [candidate division KSB1 bacterium]MDZ7274406.1 aminodeoxychorismate synthase component I [candidate division KSB1 bacterium]MDZ7284932.1 aminodeoxychorismate synthase component I [candidate division KSB1 bacterium]MDZ7297647.1 aminodeoxychorismate synthase component I [candidate division KSB1 bacterium]MDZ7348514.1 aminodeoxychorismate synthase component I [candidate division KSB1 bacterium]